MDARHAQLLDALTTALVGPLQYTADEAAGGAGLHRAQARTLRQALGFSRAPGDSQRLYTEMDVRMLKLAAALNARRLADPEVLLQVVRVTGQALARMAQVQLALVDDEIREAVADDAADTDRRAVEVIHGLVESIEPFIVFAWRRHLLVAAAQAVIDAEDPSTEAREGVVGFVDLVGFTALSQEISERELAACVERFERLVYEKVPEAGGRIVKMIGDEVMFFAEDEEAAARIALELVEASEARAGLPARAGVAAGKIVPFEGDVFGPTVNLASRLVNVARPGTALVSAEVAERLASHAQAFVLRRLKPLKLKGFGRKITAHVLRRAAQADAA